MHLSSSATSQTLWQLGEWHSQSSFATGISLVTKELVSPWNLESIYIIPAGHSRLMFRSRSGSTASSCLCALENSRAKPTWSRIIGSSGIYIDRTQVAFSIHTYVDRPPLKALLSTCNPNRSLQALKRDLKRHRFRSHCLRKRGIACLRSANARKGALKEF